MKVLLVKPLEHPQVVEIEHTLDAMYRILECETITATYPREAPLALVTDDEGLFSDKIPSRYIRELEQPIMGNSSSADWGRRISPTCRMNWQRNTGSGSGCRNSSSAGRAAWRSSPSMTARGRNKGKEGGRKSSSPSSSLLYITSG